MKQKQTKRNLDSNGQHHGYQEVYDDDELYCRGNSKHGLDIGYQEYHLLNETEFYIR